MVIQKAVNNLKEGPKEDKVAVASGIAMSVVIILLVGWAFFFLRNLARNSHDIRLEASPQDSFNFPGVSEAQKALQQGLSDTGDNSTSDSSTESPGEPVPMQTGQESDQFGTSGSTH